MNTRGVGKTVLTLALVFGAAACNDDPTSEGRDQGAYMYVNPVNAAVDAGDTTVVIATVMNKYGTPTNEAVSAEPCDGKVTATADPRRSAFESPETFLVIGQTLGVSCVVVRGGGITDTAVIRVVPASIRLVGDTLLQSGEPYTTTVQFLNTAGQPVTGPGFDLTGVTLSSGTTTVAVIDSLGNVSARAPGDAPLIVRLKNTWGVARSDTLIVHVSAGSFNGTFSPTNPHEGSLVTINAGTLQFDSDTQVLWNGTVWPWLSNKTATTLTIVTPPTGDIVIANIGESQVALNATIPVVSYEPLDNDLTTERIINVGDSTWVHLDGGDIDDLVKVVIPANGTYNVTVDWTPTAADIDVYFYRPDGSFTSFGGTYPCASGARPENCNVTLTAGTWYLDLNLYDPHGDAWNSAKLKVTSVP